MLQLRNLSQVALLGPSKTTPTTGWSVITRSADQQRLPRCSRAQDSSSSQQPRCVLIAPHISSRFLQLGGGAACALQDIRHRRQQTARSPPPATLGWRAPGNPPSFSASSSTSAGLEVATTAAAATAAQLPALRRCHCEAAAVIHRRAVGTRLAVSQKSVGSPLAVRPQQSQASQQPASG